MRYPFYFYVEIPEAGIGITWIGGGLQPSQKPGRVWLTTPAGKRVLEVPREHVHPTTHEETAARIQQDALASKAPLN